MNQTPDYQSNRPNNIPYSGDIQFLKFTPKTDDSDLIHTIEQWMKESRSYHDSMLLKQNESVKYYLGLQTDKDDIPTYNSNTVYNRIFEATETIIPVITGAAHQFLAVPGLDNEQSLARAKKLQKVLQVKYDELEIQSKLESTSRDLILKRFGVIKYFWNTYTDDIDCKVIDPRLILIPKLRMDANDPQFPYVMELQEYTRDEMAQEFPDVDLNDITFGKTNELETNSATARNNDQAPVYQVIEVWTNETVVWKQGDKILKKMANPYYDFEGEDTERREVKINKGKSKIVTKTYKQFYNFLPYPHKPYIFFNPFISGDAPVSETSIAEVAIPIQDDINTQKRQIINNLVKMGNGQVYVDLDAIPKELQDSITNEPGLIITGKNIVSENRIKREPGVPLPTGHFTNLQESIIAFDNVFGTHGALRGSSNSETLGGQMLNRQQDLSRVEQLTRCLNRGVSRLANGLVQLMKLYYDGEHIIKYVGKDGAVDFIRFTRKDIDDDTRVVVKSGTPPILDPIARYNQAIQLWQLGALDPETLYERMDFANPQAASQKLQAWKQGQLVFDSQLRQKEAVVGAAAKAAAPSGEGERKVETPNDVIARTRAALGGEGGAPLKATPKGGNPSVIA